MIKLVQRIESALFQEVSNAPLIVFRCLFGCLLLCSPYRMLSEGWVQQSYIDPTYHFSFISWLEPLSGAGMYWVFYVKMLLACFIVLGFCYRISVALYLLLFVYVELLDKTFYLNHYYLVSLLLFWLLLVPANRRRSIDAMLFPAIHRNTCRAWCILVFKVQLSIVYFFAGFAKVNPDWLFRAQPLAAWLPSLYQLPIIGKVVHLKMVAFLFSWAGCLYDLLIWIFLWMKKWRGLAYFLVIVFHVLTGILFPRIGMFPYIMVISTVIFFSSEFHERLLSFIPAFRQKNVVQEKTIKQGRRSLVYFIMFYFAVQLLLPFRFLQHDGNLFWHERGYRFSWRVMLMEKSGQTAIIVRDPVMEKQYEVDQDTYLTPFQQKQMRSQPDMIHQFSTYIGDEFKRDHGYSPEIYVKSRMSLNGRQSQQFTDDSINIYQKELQDLTKWILPFEE